MSAPDPHGGTRASWNSADTRPCRLRVVNRSEAAADALWVSVEGNEASYAVIQPNTAHIQATFSTHVWRLRDYYSRALLIEHVGGDTTLVIEQNGPVAALEGFRTDVLPGSATPPPREWGAYRTRLVTPMGIPITAWDCVGDTAVRATADTMARMLQLTPPDVVRRMVESGGEVAIIGRNQVTSDIPAHASLKGQDACGGGRTFDDGCRGVGGTPGNPTTSVGEENVTMTDDKFYFEEDILIHELSHAVMEVGLPKEKQAEIKAAHGDALAKGLYNPSCYMASNEKEYWAEGAQAWFEATVRCDVNCGINTRDKLKAHDPALAAILQYTYGDGPWRFPHTAPAPLGSRRQGAHCNTPPGQPNGQTNGVGATQQASKPGYEASLVEKVLIRVSSCCGASQVKAA